MLRVGAIGQECTEVVCAKSQWVRLVDVFVIGPLMVWGGVRLARSRHPIAGGSLATFGAATVIYNARNYFDTRYVRRQLALEQERLVVEIGEAELEA
jgi:hypothetical protein